MRTLDISAGVQERLDSDWDDVQEIISDPDGDTEKLRDAVAWLLDDLVALDIVTGPREEER